MTKECRTPGETLVNGDYDRLYSFNKNQRSNCFDFLNSRGVWFFAALNRV
jgi:hypothetical protein